MQVSKDAMVNKTADGDRAMNYLEKGLRTGRHDEFALGARRLPALFHGLQALCARDARPDRRRRDELQKIAANIGEYDERPQDRRRAADGRAEKKAFRDAVIDFQSGKNRKPKPPAPPKKPDFQRLKKEPRRDCGLLITN